MSDERILGGYRIGEEIGAVPGGHAYRAVEVAGGSPVVLKVLDPPTASQSDHWQRQLAETRRLTRIVRPGMPVIYEITETGEGWLIALEPPAGTPLGQYVTAGGRVDRRQLAEWGCQLLELLAEAHANDVLHRHLGAEVVRIGDDGRLALTGFALTVLDEDAAELMPPEQRRGEPLSAASDLYSLAALLRRLAASAATGGASETELAPDDPLVAVFEKAMVHDPRGRFQDAAEMEEALRLAARPSAGERGDGASEELATGRSIPPSVVGSSPAATQLIDLEPLRELRREAERAAAGGADAMPEGAEREPAATPVRSPAATPAPGPAPEPDPPRQTRVPATPPAPAAAPRPPRASPAPAPEARGRRSWWRLGGLALLLALAALALWCSQGPAPGEAPPTDTVAAAPLPGVTTGGSE